MEGSKNKDRWRPLIWKWALAVALFSCSVGLALWPSRSAKVELLPFTDTPPAFDGSRLRLIISPVAVSTPVRFKTSISLVQPTVRHDSPVNEFDVDLQNGKFILRQTDLFVPDVMPLSLTRTYAIWDTHSRAFGVGGNHPYDICPTGTRFPYTYQDLNLEDSFSVYFSRVSKGTGFADAVFRHGETSSEFFGAQDAWNGNGWTLTFRDGRKFYFPEAYYAKNFAQGAPTEMADAEGHRIQLKRDKVRNLKQVVSPSGHTITLKYDPSDRVTQAQDDEGHIRKYSYDASGHLDMVADETKVLYRFEYQWGKDNGEGNDPWLLTAILDGDWNVILKNKFLRGRVAYQKLADGEVYYYEYKLTGRDVLQTTVTLPPGEKKVFSFQHGILIQQK